MTENADRSGLEGRQLVCIRGERPVFARLDFHLAPGAGCRLVGPNGSGKSSLLRLLAGLIAPAAGGLFWDGAPVRDDREGHRARLSYVGHQDAVKPALSVRESLAFWAALAGTDAGVGDIGPTLDRALAAFDLSALAETRGRVLSSGQKRRAALARLLVEARPLWLLDEPTVGLDTSSIAALEARIADHRTAGGIVIAATHVPIDMKDADTIDMTDFPPGRGVEAAA